MATIGRINTIISATTAPLTKGIGRARTAITGFAGGITGLVGKIAPLAAGIAGTAAAFKGLSDAADFEQTEIAFTTLLGSADAAKKVIGDVAQFAAETPFEMPQLAGAARSLAAFGTSADDIVPTLRRIGDISSGIGAPIDEIAELYGKAQVQGRLFGEDINQLTGRGIPIIGELAKQFDVSEAKVKGLVSAGKVGFPELQKAFENMTNEGGKFAGLMAAQSQSLSGLWSTLKDNMSLVFRDLAQIAIDAFGFKDIAAGSIGVVGSIRNMIAKIKPILTQLANVTKTVWDSISSGAVQLWNMLGMNSASTFDQMSDFVLDFLIISEYVFQNLGPIAQLLWEKIKLGAVSMFEDIKYRIQSIPTLLSWLGDNWSSIWRSMLDYTLTVFINLGKNIRSAMKSIWAFIKSGGRSGLNIAWTPLTEGFVNTVKELPDIPERALSELESKIKTRVDSMGAGLTDGLAEHMKTRRSELLSESDTQTFEEVPTQQLEVGVSEGLTKTLSDLEGPASVQRGSADAFSQIFSAMRGGDSVDDKILKANETANKTLQKIEMAVKNQPAGVELVAGAV